MKFRLWRCFFAWFGVVLSYWTPTKQKSPFHCKYGQMNFGTLYFDCQLLIYGIHCCPSVNFQHQSILLVTQSWKQHHVCQGSEQDGEIRSNQFWGENSLMSNPSPNEQQINQEGPCPPSLSRCRSELNQMQRRGKRVAEQQGTGKTGSYWQA